MKKKLNQLVEAYQKNKDFQKYANEAEKILPNLTAKELKEVAEAGDIDMRQWVRREERHRKEAKKATKKFKPYHETSSFKPKAFEEGMASKYYGFNPNYDAMSEELSEMLQGGVDFSLKIRYSKHGNTGSGNSYYGTPLLEVSNAEDFKSAKKALRDLVNLNQKGEVSDEKFIEILEEIHETGKWS